MTKAKKILALVMAVVMCLSVMVGTLSVSAATPGTITVGTTTVDEGAASATVTVTIAGAAFSAGEIKMTYDSKLPVPTVASALQITADTETAGKVNVVVESGASTAGNVDSGSFTLTFAGIEALTAGDYAITVDSSEFGDYDENDVLFDAVAGKITVIAKPSHEHSYEKTITKQPTKDEVGIMTFTCECEDTYTEEIPTLAYDKNMSMTNGLGLGSTAYVSFKIPESAVSAYDDFHVVVTRGVYDGNYNAVETPTVLKKSDALLSGGVYYLYYYGIELYAMTSNIAAYIVGTDEGVDTHYSETFNTSLAQVAKDQHAASSGNTAKKKKLRTVLTDFLNAGAAVQSFFAGRFPNSDLAKATLPNEGFTQADATAEVPTLATTTSSDSHGTGVTCVIGGAAAENVYLSYRFQGATGYTQSNLKAVFSYYDAVTKKTVTETVNGADFLKSGSNLFAYFRNVSMYASNSTVSVKLYNGETLIYSGDYCLEKYYSDNLTSTKLGTMIPALAKLGASARAQFGV